jgi:hypothetical protein
MATILRRCAAVGVADAADATAGLLIISNVVLRNHWWLLSGNEKHADGLLVLLH